MTDPERAVLVLLAEGRTTEEILRMRPDLTADHVRRAAALALERLDAAPRIETRDERVARLRQTHPRAYEPWTDDEDTRLLRRFDEGARVPDLAREMGRPPNAIRARLERWLGPSWRDRGVARGVEQE